MSDVTASEMMTIAASRALSNDDVCFVGIGAPSAACNVARLTHAPDITLIYESGTIGTAPDVLPLSIGDGELCETALTTVSVPEMFRYWLQGGRVTVGFLGAAQLDKFGNINTTVIGDGSTGLSELYRHPKVRLPGSGGACEIAIHAQKVFVIMRLKRRAFVEQLDFRTSAGHLNGEPGGRTKLGMPGTGPQLVVTDKAIFRFEPDNGEMYLASVHPGVTVEEVQAEVSWSLRIAVDLKTTRPPTGEELYLIREKLDPEGAYTR